MLKIGINYKTPAAERAIHNLKVSTQKRFYRFKDAITPELKAKKEYMQSSSFWNEPHNVKMVSLYDNLMQWRDEIARNIVSNNAKPDAQIQKQGINGFTRIKKYLDKNPKMNYWRDLSIHDKANNEYNFAKMRIYNLARTFKSQIGR